MTAMTAATRAWPRRSATKLDTHSVGSGGWEPRAFDPAIREEGSHDPNGEDRRELWRERSEREVTHTRRRPTVLPWWHGPVYRVGTRSDIVYMLMNMMVRQ